MAAVSAFTKKQKNEHKPGAVHHNLEAGKWSKGKVWAWCDTCSLVPKRSSRSHSAYTCWPFVWKKTSTLIFQPQSRTSSLQLRLVDCLIRGWVQTMDWRCEVELISPLSRQNDLSRSTWRRQMRCQTACVCAWVCACLGMGDGSVSASCSWLVSSYSCRWQRKRERWEERCETSRSFRLKLFEKYGEACSLVDER